MTTITKLLGLVPAWLWASIVSALLLLNGTTYLSLVDAKLEASDARTSVSDMKQSIVAANNRTLLNMAERNATLSNELLSVREKAAQDANELQDANVRIAKLTRSLYAPPSEADLERDFRAAGYNRASTYAAGVEGVYRSCAKEYIDLGIGVGGAAEAATAAHAQKARADALVRALKPVPPVPPTPPVK